MVYTEWFCESSLSSSSGGQKCLVHARAQGLVSDKIKRTSQKTTCYISVSEHKAGGTSQQKTELGAILIGTRSNSCFGNWTFNNLSMTGCPAFLKHMELYRNHVSNSHY